MAPSGRVCNGDERPIIPSWSKCDGGDVEQIPLGLMDRGYEFLGKFVGMTGKMTGISFRHVSHEDPDMDVALDLLNK